MSEEAKLTVTQHDDVSVVDFCEATILDAYHVDQISKELYALVEVQKSRKIVLDLATIKMLSSQTLGVFLNMRKKLSELGGTMVFAGVDPRLYRVFKVTNLQALFEFFEDRDTAVQSFSQP